MGDKLFPSEEKTTNEEKDEDSDSFEIRLKDSTAFDQAISALHKAVRRGLEEDALVLAVDLYESNFGAALAKRVIVIGSEDVGLADPAAVAQACIYATTWLALRKDQKHQPDMLLLALAVMVQTL